MDLSENEETKMLDFKAIGNGIRERRQRLGYSQDALAETLGVTHQAISRWEQGEAMPTVENLAELCSLFDIGFEELLLLGRPVDPTAKNIFDGHSRTYVVKEIISGRCPYDFVGNFNVFMPQERIMLLRAVKEGKLTADLLSLRQKLTQEERIFLFGKKQIHCMW